MPQNFLACDREQELLLEPSLREWLAEDHFAWFVIDVVGELDLAAFCVAYRADGHGRAAHDPAMMVASMVYAMRPMRDSHHGKRQRESQPDAPTSPGEPRVAPAAQLLLGTGFRF